MKSRGFFSLLHKAIKHTPMYGRTIAVLGFVFLCVKQFFLYQSAHELLKEVTLGGTIANYLAYLVSDFFVFFLMLILIVINRFLKKKIWRIINNIILAAVFLLFVLDIFTMYFFQSRLSILDLSQFMEPSVWQFSGRIIGSLLLFFVIGIFVFLFVQSKAFKKNQRAFLSVGGLIFAAACVLTSIYASAGFSLPDNILSINFTALKQLAFPSSRESGSINSYQKFFTKIDGENQKPNIIIIFAESLSAIDSQTDVGVNNNLPYFDKIQSEGIRLTNFIANGCTSDTAHIALLEGVEPWKFAWQQDGPYSGYVSYTESLPKFFAKQGYTSIFLSTASLDFLNQGNFLSGLGFHQIIGEEAFKSEKKYVFDAAPDQALYIKTLETIKQQTKPYLAVLQTISFHKPYNSPYGNTEKDALRYADKSLYYFYQQLKKSGFFDSGLLVIVGDHRKMNPLSANEKEILGKLRYAKPVATIIGKGIKAGSTNTNILQYTDIFYSLKQLVGKGKVTVSKLFNNVFSAQKRRSRGVVFCRYFTNIYGVASDYNSGTAFAHATDIKSYNPSIYRYLQAYTAFQQPIAANGTKKSSDKGMIIIAHRGSPQEVTENSLAGFLLAQKHGADGIEFDVSQTKDKQNIVLHGETTYSTTCGDNTKIGTHDLSWLQEHCPLTNGERLMTLEEMLTQVKGLFDYYFVEIKVYNPADAEQQTLSAIQTVHKLGMEDNVIFTSYDKTATYLLGSYKNIHAGWDTYNLSELDILPHFQHEYYLMDKTLITETMSQEVGDMGKQLVVYVVNTLPELDKVYHQGVHIIMTDDVITMSEGIEKLTLEER